ncbi:MAG: hypothetical protein N3D84_03810 [Candidatus Woesearchaeota archaeon]|nr:hypothetical protein [Candidatus Woesearchaeota archaeon]
MAHHFHIAKFLLLILLALGIIAFTDSKPVHYLMYLVIMLSVFFIFMAFMLGGKNRGY